MLDSIKEIEIIPTGPGLSLERGLCDPIESQDSFRIVAIFKNRPLSSESLPQKGMLCTYDDQAQKLDLSHYSNQTLIAQTSLPLPKGMAALGLRIHGLGTQTLTLNFNVVQPPPLDSEARLYLSAQGLTYDDQFVSGEIRSPGTCIPGPFAAALLIPWDQLGIAVGKDSRGVPPAPVVDQYLNTLCAMFFEFWILKGQPKILKVAKLNDWSACLVLIASLSTQNYCINFHFPLDPLPPPWRRLAQNLQLRHLASNRYDMTVGVELAASLEEWLPLFKPHLADIKLRISNLGIVPGTLWES